LTASGWHSYDYTIKFSGTSKFKPPKIVPKPHISFLCGQILHAPDIWAFLTQSAPPRNPLRWSWISGTTVAIKSEIVYHRHFLMEIDCTATLQKISLSRVTAALKCYMRSGCTAPRKCIAHHSPGADGPLSGRATVIDADVPPLETLRSL
jgi:hypothetical protein